MTDVKEVLRRWAAGHSHRKIERETGTDRGTAARYIAVAEQLAFPRERELSEAEIHEVAQRVQARPLPDPSAERKAVAEHKQRIVDWLGETRPLRLSKIHTLLVRDHGLVASYDTLRRYAMEELGWKKKEPTILLEEPPAGQEAQVDFGKMGMLLDGATGRMRSLWVLLVTLSFSRYQFVWPTFVQTTEAVCEGLDRAWWFFGAMSRTIIPDNMSSVIKESGALNPTLVASFLDYVQEHSASKGFRGRTGKVDINSRRLRNCAHDAVSAERRRAVAQSSRWTEPLRGSREASPMDKEGQ